MVAGLGILASPELAEVHATNLQFGSKFTRGTDGSDPHWYPQSRGCYPSQPLVTRFKRHQPTVRCALPQWDFVTIYRVITAANLCNIWAKVSGQQLQRGRIQSGGGEVSGCGPDGIRSGDACGGGDCKWW